MEHMTNGAHHVRCMSTAQTTYCQIWVLPQPAQRGVHIKEHLNKLNSSRPETTDN